MANVIVVGGGAAGMMAAYAAGMCGHITRDLHNSDFTNNIMTEYEEKFSKNGIKINRLEAYK